MAIPKSRRKFLLVVSLPALFGLLFLGQMLNEMTAHHPPATQAIARTRAVLDEAGFHSDVPAPDLFGPGFSAREPLKLRTRLSHRVVEAGKAELVHASVAIQAQAVPTAPSDLPHANPVVATNTSVHLRLRPGVRVSLATPVEQERTEEGIRFSLGSFAANERKDITATMEVGPHDEGRHELFTIDLRYDDAQGVQVDKVLPADLQFGERSEIESFTAQRVVRVDTALVFERATTLYRGGDRFEAAELLDTQRYKIEAILDDYDLSDASLQRVSEQLGELAASMRRTERRWGW